MPNVIEFLFFLAALICFVAAAFAVGGRWAGKVNLIALGLALWIFPLFWDRLEGLG